MSIYDTYGFQKFSLDEVQEQLEKLLGIKFELHYSSYKGDYCLFEGINNEEYEIVNNYTEEEGWVLEERKDITVVLRVSNFSRPDELRKLLFSEMKNILFVERTMLTRNNEELWDRRYYFKDGHDELVFEQLVINRKVVKTWHSEEYVFI